MKSKQIFWGVFFITIGVLILLSNYIHIAFDFGDFWKLWPLLIVVVGINLMMKNQLAKSLLAGVIALLLAVALYASFASLFCWVEDAHDFRFDRDSAANYDAQYSAEFEKGTEKASLHLEAGAGSFTIADSTDLLFYADVEGKNTSYSLHTETQDHSSRVRFKMKSQRIFMKHKNRVDMKLNPIPEWDLEFDIGAAAVDFDLDKFNVSDLDIQMGAASLVLRLGKINDECHVNIDAGASSIEIMVPDDVWCEIKVDASLSSKEFHGFTKVNDHLYRTDDHKDAEKKIYLDIESGISSIKVSRSAW